MGIAQPSRAADPRAAVDGTALPFEMLDDMLPFPSVASTASSDHSQPLQHPVSHVFLMCLVSFLTVFAVGMLCLLLYAFLYSHLVVALRLVIQPVALCFVASFVSPLVC